MEAKVDPNSTTSGPVGEQEGEHRPFEHCECVVVDALLDHAAMECGWRRAVAQARAERGATTRVNEAEESTAAGGK